MAASDYTFCEGMKDIYLAKIKKRNNGLMSEDRRPLTDDEQMYIAEHFLREYCRRNKTNEVVVTNNGQSVFKMTLLDKL